MLTIEGLNAIYIILRKLELCRAGGQPVDGVHQSFFFVWVKESQGVAKLMSCNQE